LHYWKNFEKRQKREAYENSGQRSDEDLIYIAKGSYNTNKLLKGTI
jgi:hypothetical protein